MMLPVIVRMGQPEVYLALKARLEDPGQVQVIWDRRVRERRTDPVRAGSTDAGSRNFLGGVAGACYARAMKTRLCATAIPALLLMAACATAPALPTRSELGDIAMPEGLTYQPDQSTIIESPSVRAARLLYRGRVEPGSLALAMQTTLEATGWRLVRNTFTAAHGTTQLYEKGDGSLQVRVWEGGPFNVYTYVELTGSRSTPGTSTTATR